MRMINQKSSKFFLSFCIFSLLYEIDSFISNRIAYHADHLVKKVYAHNDASLSNDPELEISTEVNLKNWRAFRAKLVKQNADEGFGDPHTNWDENRWAHSIGCVEKGCLLLAHESLQGVFRKTAVLVVEHGPSSGTIGLIINRPTKRRIANLPGLGEKLKLAFGKCTVYYGGPVGSAAITTLHNVQESKDSDEIIPQVYIGGLEDVINLGNQGKIRSSSLRLTMGHAAWEPGQLERELKANFWYLAAASPQIMIGSNEKEVSNMWHQVLELMGGPYANIANNNKY